MITIYLQVCLVQNQKKHKSKFQQNKIIDSNKPTQEPVVEQPVVEEQSLNTMNLNSNYIPVQTSFESEDDVIDLRNLKPSHYKTISIILGITLLVVLLAFPLYFGLNNYLTSL